MDSTLPLRVQDITDVALGVKLFTFVQVDGAELPASLNRLVAPFGSWRAIVSPGRTSRHNWRMTSAPSAR